MLNHCCDWRKGCRLKILLKHADRIEQVEALLFGQAGLFEYGIFEDDYQKVLKREYHLLSTKYQLGPSSLTKDQWKFLRMRPANFPTIRIAQLAMLIHQQRNLFSRFLQATCYNELQAILDIQQSPYWQTHFHFGKESETGSAIVRNGKYQYDNHQHCRTFNGGQWKNKR